MWHFLQSPAADAATNMAVDEALLRTAPQRGRPLLRVYSWERPAISIGYFQKFPVHLAGQYQIVRRPTGGGLVYHGDDTTYTIVVPPTHSLYKMSTTDAYCAIHRAVAAALGDKSRIITTKTQTPRTGYDCFQNPVAGDVVADGRKLAGAAQRRTKFGMLHQGSIDARVTGEQLCRAFGVQFNAHTMTGAERFEAEGLVCEKYSTDAWNRRVTVRAGG